MEPAISSPTGSRCPFSLNHEIPESAIEEAIRRLTVTATPSLIKNNHIFHKYLTDDISVQQAVTQCLIVTKISLIWTPFPG